MAAAHLRPPPPAPARQPTAGADLPPPLAFSAKPHHAGVKIGGTPAKLAMIRRAPLVLFGSVKRSTVMVEGTREPSALARELTEGELQRSEESSHDDPFRDLKSRFLRFKKEKCVENPIQFHNLAQAQAPKFMVIACADSRVCPSHVLGFQPGEAFTVRNVANLVPPFQHGASETSAALEFAVNSLEVANILVVGHSCCGGIQALMSMKEGADSSFIKEWVSIGKSARLSTKAAAGNQSFEMQCKHCEKESINGSLLNLLTYPWIERRVREGRISIHGGYYDFVNCTFEKWTLVYREHMEGGSKFGIKDRAFWS